MTIIHKVYFCIYLSPIRLIHDTRIYYSSLGGSTYDACTDIRTIGVTISSDVFSVVGWCNDPDATKEPCTPVPSCVRCSPCPGCSIASPRRTSSCSGCAPIQGQVLNIIYHAVMLQLCTDDFALHVTAMATRYAYIPASGGTTICWHKLRPSLAHACSCSEPGYGGSCCRSAWSAEGGSEPTHTPSSSIIS